MQTKKDILDVIYSIEKNVAEVNQEIKRTIEGEGLDQDKIKVWISHLNKILHNVDHAVEVLMESQN